MFTFSSYNMSCAEMTAKVGVAHKISSTKHPPTVNPGSTPVYVYVCVCVYMCGCMGGCMGGFNAMH